MLSPSPSHRAPGRIRTPNRQIRSLVLYPIELRVPESGTKVQQTQQMQAQTPSNTYRSMGIGILTATSQSVLYL